MGKENPLEKDHERLARYCLTTPLRMLQPLPVQGDRRVVYEYGEADIRDAVGDRVPFGQRTFDNYQTRLQTGVEENMYNKYGRAYHRLSNREKENIALEIFCKTRVKNFDLREFKLYIRDQKWRLLRWGRYCDKQSDSFEENQQFQSYKHEQFLKKQAKIAAREEHKRQPDDDQKEPERAYCRAPQEDTKPRLDEALLRHSDNPSVRANEKEEEHLRVVLSNQNSSS